MRTIALRVAALALLLLLVLVGAITVRMLNRLPNSVVYFVEVQDTRSTLKGVQRRFDANTPDARLRAVLGALIEGPEGDVNLSSAVPPNTEVRGLKLTGSRITVDLSEEFAREGEALGRLNQLFYTLSQPTGVESVSLLIEGKPINSVDGEVVSQPWRRPEGSALPTWSND